MTTTPATAAESATPILVRQGYVPVIDISSARSGALADRQAVGAAIDEACRTSGFLIIVGHGVDRDLVQRMHDVTLDFFHQPDEWKKQLACGPGDPTIRGLFERESSVSAGENVQTAPDLCQLFTINQLGESAVAARAGLGDSFPVWSRPNVWPDRPVDFRSTWTTYYGAMSDLALQLMQLCAVGLRLPEDFFTPLIDVHISNLTANWYPPVTTDPAVDQYRKGPHSDWGTLTVLYQDGVGGLEVLGKSGEWLEVPAIQDSFVVNIGDLMAVWTNDQWLSTKHRVLVPTAGGRTKERVSIPFFHQPNWAASIECLPSSASEDNPPRHQAVTSGSYLLGKIQAAFGGGG